MNKSIFLLLSIALLAGCNLNKDQKMNNENPFLSEYQTSFQVPPFDQIKLEHYLPAFKEGISKHEKEIDKIVSDSREPDFNNTILTLDQSGEILTKVSSVFYNQTSVNTNKEIQEIARDVSPLLSQHRDNILLNAKLFERIKAVNGQKDDLDLTTEQKMLLNNTYKEFIRGGANLSADAKEKLREINKNLSLLSLKFGENVLSETNKFKLVIDDKADLAGLTSSIIATAAETADNSGDEGKWVFTIQKPSMIPFLQYADNRALREKIFKAYIDKGNHDDEQDNKDIVSEMVSLRLEKANLLGYKTHADFILEENMSKKPENVYALLNKVMDAALPVAKTEVVNLQKMINKDGGNFNLMPWDWWYYAEKLRKEKYDLDEAALRPYFEIENVRKGLFEVVNKLFGLQFVELKDIPLPHPDAKAFEVKEADGSHVGILYMDFYPRESKRGGAWMSNYREQYVKDGEKVYPVITTVFNFTKPAGDEPSLLSFEEVSTMYHEFGHALHGLLSNCTYVGVSGTNVARDFVELPSQIMENWASAPENIKSYAKHYKTGETIPDDLLEKLVNSSHFNQGFVTVEYLSASFLDMNWHTVTSSRKFDVNGFEKKAMDKIKLIPEIVVRYRSPYFSHIFAGGYSAGYYGYIWAEVLDADAFEAFKETGDIFDKNTANAFRKNILEKGGTEDPMELYVKFRGSEPGIDPLLRRRGLKK